MVSVDVLVIKIMNYAQRLVHADRASLFLIDSKTNELYATIFDVGFDDDIEDKMNSPRGARETTEKMRSEKIRFPIGTGIAGSINIIVYHCCCNLKLDFILQDKLRLQAKHSI
jgi:cAMP and cAMP-inhibited cGMP 3',5'-cyclic phosphodiesterase 10